MPPLTCISAFSTCARNRRPTPTVALIAPKNGMENLQARSFVELGSAYLNKSDYPDAEKYLTQGLELARRYKARYAEALALINLGSLRVQQEQPDEAVNNVNQALKFFQQ